MEKIKQIIREYEDIPFEGSPRGFDSEIYKLNTALTIVGPRHAGKTTFLREIIHSLGLKHYLFLNFKDERILPIGDLDLFIESYYELYHEKPHVFLDEVQNAENWQYKVRRLIDQNYKVFITGLNANFLSKEIATHLAGRTFVKKILPFTFREFLKLKGISFSEKSLFGKERFQIKSAFREFLVHGGFPEIVKTTLKKQVLRQYFEIVFYKDLIVRNNIRQEAPVRYLIKKLVENVGNSYNIANLRNRLTQMVKISKQSLYDYLGFLDDCFFVIHLRNYQKSFLQRETERKTFLLTMDFSLFLAWVLNPGNCSKISFLWNCIKRGMNSITIK